MFLFGLGYVLALSLTCTQKGIRMKKYVALLAVLVSISVFASQKAVTDEGEVVILNEDGTWHYENSNVQSAETILMNPTTFSTPSSASFNLKSAKTNSTFAFNPKKWKFDKNKNINEAAEYTFHLKNSDLYAMAITEELEVSVEDLSNIAFENAKNAAPDAKVVKKEYRMVNGNQIIYMEMVGTIQSIRFKYLGYYYSNSSGATQLLTYTGANLVSKYQSDIDDFLNGFATK